MASGGKKRSFAEFAEGSDPTLTVITADGGRIPAHNEVLRLACSCLRNAPASDTWDLSSLLVNGSPVSQSTVTAVLETLYSNMWALDYDAERTEGQYSLAQLLDMLLFADAVGCNKQALSKLAGMLGSSVRAQLELNMKDNTSSNSSRHRGRGAAAAAEAAEPDDTAEVMLVQLHLNSVCSVDSEDGDRVLKRWTGRGSRTVLVMTKQQWQEIDAQLPQQLEALLYVGFKLDVQQLLQPALRFLRNNAPGLLKRWTRPADNAAIYSRRVLAACGGTSGAELLSRSCTQQQLGPGFGVGHVFKNVQYAAANRGAEMDEIRFTATLLRDLYEFKSDARVQVIFGRDTDMEIFLDEACSDGSSSEEDNSAAQAHAAYSFGVVLGPEHSFSCF